MLWMLFNLIIMQLFIQGGMWLLNLVDYSVSGFPLLVVGLMELVCIAWIYGKELCENIFKIRPNIVILSLLIQCLKIGKYTKFIFSNYVFSGFV